MAVHLLRHAKAGHRHEWAQPDELRPRTPAGMQQALALRESLAALPVKRILSSRYLRCVQTVAPLAERLGLEVELHPALAEEADVADTWDLLEELAGTGTDAVLCTHGNVTPPVIDRLVRRGGRIIDHDPGNKKGSVWTLEADGDGRFTTATYVPPPVGG